MLMEEYKDKQFIHKYMWGFNMHGLTNQDKQFIHKYTWDFNVHSLTSYVYIHELERLFHCIIKNIIEDITGYNY